MMNITPTVKQLLIINIIFFIGSELIKNNVAYHYLSLYFFENPQFYAWQPLTHMFMHGGIMHIFFNMFALYSFGSALEHFWGGKKFLFFYISCGLGAALLDTGVNYYFFHNGLTELINAGFSQNDIIELLNKNMIDRRWTQVLGESGLDSFAGAYAGAALGASGAIYGLLVAFAFMFPNAELMMFFIPIPIKAKYFVPAILLMDLFSGVTGISIFGGGNIGHFAHIGGAIVGFIMMWYWKKNQFHNNRWN